MTKEKDCKHWKLKVRRHRGENFCCLHCLDCNSTWSDPARALSFLKKFKAIMEASK